MCESARPASMKRRLGPLSEVVGTMEKIARDFGTRSELLAAHLVEALRVIGVINTTVDELRAQLADRDRKANRSGGE